VTAPEERPCVETALRQSDKCSRASLTSVDVVAVSSARQDVVAHRKRPHARGGRRRVAVSRRGVAFSNWGGVAVAKATAGCSNMTSAVMVMTVPNWRGVACAADEPSSVSVIVVMH